jgi:hypothetical protein
MAAGAPALGWDEAVVMLNCEICGKEFERRVRAAVRAAEGNDPDPWRLYPSRVGGLNPSEATARVTAA